MCGICGTKGLSLNNFQDNLDNMLVSLTHRGPDEEGRYCDAKEDLFLGIRRLSIIDLTPTGSQPIYNEDKSIVLVCNGEIYNFPLLKEELIQKGHRFYTKTDTEVIAHLYEDMGVDCLKKLKGMFTLALWDRKNKLLFIARDRLGIKPLYYCTHNGIFAFASELKALLKLPFISKQLDLRAMDLYFSLEYVPSPFSIFKDIYKLKPGHYLIYKDSQIKMAPFWNLDNFPQGTKGITFNEAAERLEYLLGESVKEHLLSDVPLGILLSGGLDSSTLVALASRDSSRKCDTFSIGFTEKSFDETKYAQRVAKYFTVRHHHHTFTLRDLTNIFSKATQSLDEPLGDLSIFPTYLLSRFTRQYVKTALSGEGADELFMGYPTYLAHKYTDDYRKVPPVFKKLFLGALTKCLPVSFEYFSLDFKVKQFLRGAFLQNPCLRHLSWMGSFLPSEKEYFYNQGLRNKVSTTLLKDYCQGLFSKKEIKDELKMIQYLDMASYLSEDILVKADRASMATSLELRVPYLDHNLVEFMWRLPPDFIFQKRLLKFVMGKYLPPGITSRKKKGFAIPFAKWIQEKDFFMLVENFFSEDFVKKQGLFNHGYIKQMLAEHLAQRRDNRKKLGTYIMFQSWYQNNLMS
ncbi:asparagine synthase (glutamine-hydrolyzing) [Candidatus Omnitrophota bacterium]